MLNNGNKSTQDFTAKRAALFASLDDASKELKGTALDQTSADNRILNAALTRNTGRKSSISHLRGKESIFKKPELPLARCLKPRKKPDYQMNPHKWKKYSLSDVDISDQTNTAAAFTFLKQIDDQQEEAERQQGNTDDGNTTMSTEAKIEFKRSSKIRRNLKALTADELADAEVDKPKLRGSKLIMPEYVIGQNAAQRQKKPKIKNVKVERATAGKLTLSHLQDDDDDVEQEKEAVANDDDDVDDIQST